MEHPVGVSIAKI